MNMKAFQLYKKISLKIEKTFSEEHLIIFDIKVVALIFASFILFFLMVAFKIHGSSLPIWNQLVTQEDLSRKEDRIFGWPKGVRSDEWVVSTPFMISQALQEPPFPIQNRTLGAANTPMLMNLPVRHISTLFRPQHWGFFFLDVERGFSFFWNFKHLSLFLGFFFLFMLLTRNKFWLSVFGSLWVYFSSYTQWWFNASEMMGIASMLFVAISYMILSRKKLNIILSATLLTILGVDFVLFLYPPFQVQLGYLILFLLIGFLTVNFSKGNFKKEIIIKSVAVFVSALISVAVLYSFYEGAKETMKIIMETVYPGSRRSIGRGLRWTRYFSGFYSSILRDGHVPKTFLNASEASNFILFFPLIAIGTVVNYLRKKEKDFIIILMLLYIAMVTWWMKLGFSPKIANVTLWSMAPTERVYMGLGLASIIATVVFLSKNERTLKTKKQIIVASGGIFVALLSFGIYLNTYTEQYFRYRYIAIFTIFFTIASLLLLQKRRLFFGLMILFITAGPGIFVNPVSIGLGPIFKKDLDGVIKTENNINPQARWAVYGNRLLPNFFIAAGGNVLDGVKYAPPLEDIKILDPKGEYNSIYNRYAHIMMGEGKDTSKEVSFELVYADLYRINIDPCSEKLKKAGVTNLAFDEKPSDQSISCATPITENPVNNTWVYRYK